MSNVKDYACDMCGFEGKSKVFDTEYSRYYLCDFCMDVPFDRGLLMHPAIVAASVLFHKLYRAPQSSRRKKTKKR